MNDYLRTVAARNLDSIPGEPLPLVRPRALTRFEPPVLNAHASFTEQAEEPRTVAPPPAPEPGDHLRDWAAALRADRLALLNAFQAQSESAPVLPFAQSLPSVAPRMNRAPHEEEERTLPISHHTPVQTATHPALAPVAERVIERLIVREVAHPGTPAVGATVLKAPALRPLPAALTAEAAPPHPQQRITSDSLAGVTQSRAEPPSRPLDAPAGFAKPSSTVHPAPMLVRPAVPQPLPGLGQAGFERTQAPPAPTTIQVTIGRIEVRATPPPSHPTQPQRATAPVMTLEEYLRERNGGAKGGSR